MTVVRKTLIFPLLPLLTLPTLMLAQTPPLEVPVIRESHAFLTAEPRIEIAANGTVTVTLETRETCSGGEAFLGIFPQTAELNYPVYRRTGEIEVSDSTQVIAKFNLHDLEGAKFDLNGLQAKGGGQIALRLQLFGKKLNIIDRVFAYQRQRHPGDNYQRVSALVEGPFIDCVTDTSALLSWAFDQPCSCSVNLDATYIKLFPIPAPAHYEFPLRNLRPDTEYTYALSWWAGNLILRTKRYRFRTAPAVGTKASFSFAVLSDGRAAPGGGSSQVEGVNQQILTPLLNLVYRHKASFILFPGDLVTGSAGDRAEIEAQFRSFKRITQPVAGNIPLYEGVGNHDMPYLWVGNKREDNFTSTSGAEAGEIIFAEQFVNPTNGPLPLPESPPYRENVYSFDWGNAHFTMLNNNYFGKGEGKQVAHLAGDLEGSIRPEQLEWLGRDLAEARQRGQKHLFVCAHEPAFPCGGHIEDGMWWKGRKPEILARRDQFWRILCRYGVTAAFFGHEHNYSRTLIDQQVDPAFTVPIWQIVTGGAGAPFYNQDRSVPWVESIVAFYPLPHFCLVSVAGDRVTLKVISPEGLTIEEADLSLTTIPKK